MKSKCQDIRQLLEEHLDRDPAAAATGDLAAHLSECPDCRHEIAQEVTLRRSFARLPRMACPSPLAARLDSVPDDQTRVTDPAVPGRSQPATRRWWSRIGFPVWQPAALAAATAIVLILVATTIDQPGTDIAGQQYTQAEIETAREQAESTLLYALSVIHRSEKEVIGGILGEQLPQAIKGSLRKTWERTQGGQG